MLFAGTMSQSYTGSSGHRPGSSGAKATEDSTRMSSISVDESYDSGRPTSPIFIHDMPILEEADSQGHLYYAT